MKTLAELLRHETRFTRLTVIREAEKNGKKRQALFRCDCGTEKVIEIAPVRVGRTKSCGCLHRDVASKLAARTCLKHGDALQGKRAPEYGVHKTMINRCYNPKVARYPLYGGRGITVCDRWRGEDGYQNFIADLGYRPSRQHSLDRINSNGDYEPGNVKWSTRIEQANNKRNNRRVTIFGGEMTLAQAGSKFGIKAGTLAFRLRRGMSPEEAVSTPVR